MEIGGSYFPLSPYSGSDPSTKYPQHTPDQTPAANTPPPVLKQTIRAEAYGQENRQRRFYPLDRDLSHSAKHALDTYRDSDEMGQGELMNRVDVYA
ncbi:MAG: hypothetical protein OEY52_13950 [Gammaproteobacteria bacterium]|nr:hypothetical protein [Gammaproteobacteria bacterium]